VPSESETPSALRRRITGHGCAIVWLTGLPAAGKSTIAQGLERALLARGVQVYAIDGDVLRKGLCRDLGFGTDDRSENVRRAGEVAAILAAAGLVAIGALISPRRRDRETVRRLAPPAPFVEVFVDCPRDECERRDPKGLYKKARAGEIQGFTGISGAYEVPEHPDLHLRTDRSSILESVDAVVHHLEKIGVLPTSPSNVTPD
jgi:adenylylsulfate kinase